LLVLFCQPVYSQEWQRVAVPFTLADIAASDSLVALLGQSNEVAISLDDARSWTIFPHRPEGEALSLTSIWPQDRNTITLLGSNHVEENHQIFNYGSSSTNDGGVTWSNSFFRSMQSIPAHLHVLARTPTRWFSGIHSKYDRQYGAIEISDSKTNKNVFKGSAAPASLMSAIDVFDSLCLGYRFQVSALGTSGALCRSTDLGSTWDSVLSMKAEFTSRPVIRSRSASTWIMSYDSLLLQSDDTGMTWHNVLSAEAPIEDFQLLNNIGHLVLRGTNYVLATSDSGVSWYAENIESGVVLSHVQIVNDTVAYCYGPNDLIRKGSRLSIAEAETENKLSIWPNPVGRMLSVKANLSLFPITYTIWSQVGIALLAGTIQLSDEEISIAGLIPGAYAIVLTDVQGGQTIRWLTVRR
jgi:hypothetical protein